MTTRLGFQIPNFSFPGVPTSALFEQVASIASRAENAGFDTVFVMDHFYQLPALGSPDQPMLEAYTLLGALAARTRARGSRRWSRATRIGTRPCSRRSSPRST